MTSKLINEIRDATQRLRNVPVELVAELAEEYAEQCNETNNRLGNISKLLIDGFRTEAIELADQNPRVIDQVALLEFPGLENWFRYLEELGLDPPPFIDDGTVELIESSYDDLRRLEPKLNLHRKLALSQVPLRARIKVLYSLRNADPTNPIWPADIETLEHARLAEIKQEFQTVKAKEDSEQLSDLTDELSEIWSIPIPKNFIERVSQHQNKLSQKEAREQLAKVVVSLNDAFAAYDETSGRENRDLWNHFQQIAQLSPPDSIYQAAQEALQWLELMDETSENEKAFSKAVRDLEKNVDKNAPLVELEQKIYSVQKFEKELPDPLIQRVNLQRENLKLAQKRKIQLLVVGCFVLLGVLASATIWGIQSWNHSKTIEQAQQELTRSLEAGEPVAGISFFESLPGYAKSNAEILRLKGALESAVKLENERTNQFDQLIQNIDLTGSLGSDVDRRISQARDLAKNDIERKKVDLANSQVRAERTSRQNQRNDAFKIELDELIKKIESFDKNISATTDLEQLTQLKQSLDHLKSTSTGYKEGMDLVSRHLLKTIDPLTKVVDTMVSKSKEFRRADLDLSELAKLTHDLVSYEKAMAKYCQTYPDHQLANEFNLVLREARYWKAWIKWRSIAERIRRFDPKTDPQKTASELERELSEVIGGAFHFGSIDEAKIILKKIQSIAIAQQKPSSELQKSIEQVLEAEHFADYKLIISKDDDFYYDSSVEEFPTFWLIQGARIRHNEVKSSYLQKAPHCVLVADLSAKLKLWKQKTGDDVAIELISFVLEQYANDKNDVAVDSLPVSYLLLKLVESLDGSTCYLTKDVQQINKELKLVGDVNWTDPKEAAIKENRTKLTTTMQRLIKEYPRTVLVKKVRDARSDFESTKKWTAELQLEPVGFMYEHQQKWRVRRSQKIEDGSELFTIDANLSGSIVSVGRYQKDVLVDANEKFLKSGRPVFIKITKSKNDFP